jgi:hypothetical protein
MTNPYSEVDKIFLDDVNTQWFDIVSWAIRDSKRSNETLTFSHSDSTHHKMMYRSLIMDYEIEYTKYMWRGSESVAPRVTKITLYNPNEFDFSIQ